jgi:hypothetical protein
MVSFIGQRSGKSGKPRTVKSIFLYVKGEAERRVKKGSQDQMRERERERERFSTSLSTSNTHLQQSLFLLGNHEVIDVDAPHFRVVD